MVAYELAGRACPTDPAFAEPLPNGARMLGWAGRDDLEARRKIKAIYELMLSASDVAKDEQVNGDALTKLACTAELGGQVCRVDGLFEARAHRALVIEST